METKDEYIVSVTLTYKVMAYEPDHAILIAQDILGDVLKDEQLYEVKYDVV